MTKPTMPMRNTRRRPLRSARRPPTSMKPARPMKKLDDVHDTTFWL
jgi:hypothetical protein